MSTICTYTEFHCRRVVRQSVKSMQFGTNLSSSRASLFMVLIWLSQHKILLSWRMMWLLWHLGAHRIKWFSHFFASVLWSFSLQQILCLIQLSNEMLKIRTDLGDTKLNVIDDRDNGIMNGNGCAVRDAMDILLMAVSFRWWFVVCCWEPAPLYLTHATPAMTITNGLKSHSGKERSFFSFLISVFRSSLCGLGIETQMSLFEWWLIYYCMRLGGIQNEIWYKKSTTKTSTRP